MSEEFETVLSTWSVEEAHLARIHLADAGIESHLADENVVSTYWAQANAVHGVKLLVNASDAIEARAILHARSIDQQTSLESNESNSNDQEDESQRDDPDTSGSLSKIRSLKGAIIWTFLGVSGISIVVLIGEMLLTLLQSIRGY